MGNLHTETMASPIPEDQNMHTYEHTIEMHQNMHTYAQIIQMSDSLATSSNQMLQTIDSTNMSYQTDSQPEPYAIFNQTGNSHT